MEAPLQQSIVGRGLLMWRVTWMRPRRGTRCWCRFRTGNIADHGVCGGRMAIVPLRFNERMVYEQGRALQVLGLTGIAGEGPSVHGPKQITRLRISDHGFRHNQRDRSISVKAASRQSSDCSFRRDANNQTHDGGGNGPILKGDSAIRI